MSEFDFDTTGEEARVVPGAKERREVSQTITGATAGIFDRLPHAVYTHADGMGGHIDKLVGLTDPETGANVTATRERKSYWQEDTSLTISPPESDLHTYASDGTKLFSEPAIVHNTNGESSDVLTGIDEAQDVAGIAERARLPRRTFDELDALITTGGEETSDLAGEVIATFSGKLIDKKNDRVHYSDATWSDSTPPYTGPAGVQEQIHFHMDHSPYPPQVELRATRTRYELDSTRVTSLTFTGSEDGLEGTREYTSKPLYKTNLDPDESSSAPLGINAALVIRDFFADPPPHWH